MLEGNPVAKDLAEYWFQACNGEASGQGYSGGGLLLWGALPPILDPVDSRPVVRVGGV